MSSRVVAAAGMIALAGLVGCGGGSDEATEDFGAPETTEPDTDGSDLSEPAVSAAGYAEGQCYVFDGDLIGAEVPCDRPHDFEVVGVIATPFEVIPPDADERLLVACSDVIAGYTDDGLDGQGLRSVNILLNGQEGDSVTGTDDEATVCLAQAPPGLTLTASVADGGAADALDGYVAVASLAPGSCFELYGDFPSLGREASCSGDGVLRYVGRFELADDGDYPGEDAIRALRGDRCPMLAEDMGVPNAADASGTIPSEADWLVGLRTVTCDVEVVS